MTMIVAVGNAPALSFLRFYLINVQFYDLVFFGGHDAIAFERGALSDGKDSGVKIAEDLSLGEDLQAVHRGYVAGHFSAYDDQPRVDVAHHLPLVADDETIGLGDAAFQFSVDTDGVLCADAPVKHRLTADDGFKDSEIVFLYRFKNTFSRSGFQCF
jgi:hypothetical protein